MQRGSTSRLAYCREDQPGGRKKEAKEKMKGQNTTTICTGRSKEERRIESCIYKIYAKKSKRLDSIIKHILSTKLSDR